jgi:hypothetical protein
MMDALCIFGLILNRDANGRTLVQKLGIDLTKNTASHSQCHSVTNKTVQIFEIIEIA